jgi:integrase/recombinase XerD
MRKGTENPAGRAAGKAVETPMATAVADHLSWLAVHGYSPATLTVRRHYLGYLVHFLSEVGIDAPGEVTYPALESYQRHLYHLRKANGAPLSFATQAQRLIPVKSFFSWLAKSGVVAVDPAAGIVLPKRPHRLPEATLTAAEAEAVLAGPDISTPLGLRDRAILEVFYSTAIRRAELGSLRMWDIDTDRATVFVRQGKGAKDRHVPIGKRALSWIDTYVREVRGQLVRFPDDGVLFLSASGAPLCMDWTSRMVRAHVAAGVPTKRGSCHLFRHTAATLMLEAGADIRYVGEMLGHSKLETTQVYTHVSIDKLRQVHAATHPAERQSPAPGESSASQD